MRCYTQVSVSSVNPFILMKFTGKKPTLFQTCKTILICKTKRHIAPPVFKYVNTYLA